VAAHARQAGIRTNDVIIGIDGKALEMTERQFQAYVKLNYQVDARVTYNVLRGGQRLDVPLTLVRRAGP
jgi:S1-C subfamily serine protease